MSFNLSKSAVVTNFTGVIDAAIADGTLQVGTQQIDHYQTNDLYGRRCRIPAGTVGSTLVHKYDHIAICLKGDVVLVDQDGVRTQISAPNVIITKAGTQRAVYAITDVDWVTVHHSEHQDLETIEDTLGCRTMREYQLLLENEAA